MVLINTRCWETKKKMVEPIFLQLPPFYRPVCCFLPSHCGRHVHLVDHAGHLGCLICCCGPIEAKPKQSRTPSQLSQGVQPSPQIGEEIPTNRQTNQRTDFSPKQAPSALDLSPRPQTHLPFGCSVVGVIWKPKISRNFREKNSIAFGKSTSHRMYPKQRIHKIG